MMNKKGFLARGWLVAFVTAMAIIAIAYYMVFGMATQYDRSDIIDSNFNEKYNNFEESTDTVTEMFSEASNQTGIKPVGAVEAIFGSTTTVIQLIFSTLLLPGTMLEQFMADIGVPRPIATVLFVLPLAIITIIIVLVVLSSLTRGRL